MLKKRYPYYLASRASAPNHDLEVTDKYTGKVACRVAMADASAIRVGIGAAVRSQAALAAFAPDQRQAVLEHCVARFTERQEELALALCIEAGKPIKDARGEVTRLIACSLLFSTVWDEGGYIFANNSFRTTPASAQLNGSMA